MARQKKVGVTGTPGRGWCAAGHVSKECEWRFGGAEVAVNQRMSEHSAVAM
jgi:hypothetical protein